MRDYEISKLHFNHIHPRGIRNLGRDGVCLHVARSHYPVVITKGQALRFQEQIAVKDA